MRLSIRAVPYVQRCTCTHKHSWAQHTHTFSRLFPGYFQQLLTSFPVWPHFWGFTSDSCILILTDFLNLIHVYSSSPLLIEFPEIPEKKSGNFSEGNLPERSVKFISFHPSFFFFLNIYLSIYKSYKPSAFTQKLEITLFLSFSTCIITFPRLESRSVRREPRSESLFLFI